MKKPLQLFFIFLFFSTLSYGQYMGSWDKKNPFLQVKVRKTGPYFGLQRGNYLIAEVGVEHLWKKIELRDAINHAVNAGFNYNFKHNILGYDMGYWVKPHRIALTYGANLVFRTNFDTHLIGVAPVIGFKFWMLHLQTGYHFLPKRPERGFETNTFFISLRIGLANERKVDWSLGKKSGKFKI